LSIGRRRPLCRSTSSAPPRSQLDVFVSQNRIVATLFTILGGVAVGLAVGLGLSFGLATLAGDAIRNTLFGVSGRDPLIYVAVALLVAAVSLAATIVPARRATRVDPMHALRME